MSIRVRFHPIPTETLPDRLVRDAWWLAEPVPNAEATLGRPSPKPCERQAKPAPHPVTPDCQMS